MKIVAQVLTSMVARQTLIMIWNPRKLGDFYVPFIAFCNGFNECYPPIPSFTLRTLSDHKDVEWSSKPRKSNRG